MKNDKNKEKKKKMPILIFSDLAVYLKASKNWLTLPGSSRKRVESGRKGRSILIISKKA